MESRSANCATPIVPEETSNVAALIQRRQQQPATPGGGVRTKPVPAFVRLASEILDSLPESRVDPSPVYKTAPTSFAVAVPSSASAPPPPPPIVVVSNDENLTTVAEEAEEDGGEGGEEVAAVVPATARRPRGTSPSSTAPRVVGTRSRSPSPSPYKTDGSPSRQQQRRQSLPSLSPPSSTTADGHRRARSPDPARGRDFLHPNRSPQTNKEGVVIHRRSLSPNSYWNGLEGGPKKRQQADRRSFLEDQLLDSNSPEELYSLPVKTNHSSRQEQGKIGQVRQQQGHQGRSNSDPNKIVVKVPPKPQSELRQVSPRRGGPGGPHQHLHQHHQAHHLKEGAQQKHRLHHHHHSQQQHQQQKQPTSRKKKMAPPPPPTRTEASKKAVGSWISGNAYNVSHNSGKKQVEDQNIKFENDYQNQVPSNNGQHHDLDQPGGESSEAEGFEGATETLSEEDDSSTMSPANCCGDADDDKVNLVEEHFVEHHSPKAKSGTSTMERRSQLSTSRVSVATQVSNSDEQENTDGSDEDEREKKSATLPRIYAKHNKGTSMATNRNNGDLSPSRYHRKSFGHAGEMPLTLSKITDFRNAAVESPSKVLEKSVKPLTTMEMMSKRQQFLTTPSPPSSSLSLSPIKTTPPLSGNGRHGISATSSPTFKARMRSSTMATSTPLLSQQRWTSSATNLLLSTGATVLGGSLGFERRAAESSHFVIIAIDFGTTYSGYAFCFKQKPNDIHVMHKWPGDPDLSNQKTRTALLLKPNGDFDSFGFVARDRYHDLKPSEAAEYYFFEKFKMVLHHDKSLSRDTQITAVNGRSLPAAAVFRHALRFFRDHALSEIGESCGLDAGLSEEDVRWVLTVPAIWRQPAKQLMREAAYKAGMASPDNPDRLLIALEPEAAAIYCRKLKFWDLKDRAPAMSTHTWHGNSCLTEYVIKELDKGTTYMVVDCGGGTVDITVHEIMDSEGNMKEIHKASGDACGSIEVDRAFEDLMENVFGETEFRAWKRKYPSAYVHLLASFEAKKRYARPSKQDAANVSLPLAFITAFERQKKGAVEEAIQKCGITGVSWTEQGMIRLAPKKMQDLFRPTLDQLVKLVEDVLTSLPDRKINYLFLVGGFAESPLLQDRIKKEFQERTKVIIPSDPAVVVLKGASMFGVDPSVVKVRRARMTYGVGVLYPFNPKIHPQEKKVRQGDIDWCADCFDKFVVEDDSVQLGDVLLRRYTPARHDQTTLVLQLYGSKKADAEFITDQGVKHCGSLRLDLTQTRLDVAYSRNPIREIQVRMVLGDTEIRASALDLATGYHVKTNIDFLAY